MGNIKVPAFIDDVVCAENEPGVRTIHIIGEDDLTYPLPAVTADTRSIETDLVLVDAAAAGFEEWKYLEGTGIHTEDSNDNKLYDHLIELIVPGDSAIKRYTFDCMTRGCSKFAAIYTDENGVQKFVDKLSFAYQYTTGRGGENNDRNQYTLQFSKSGAAAFIYTGTIPVKTP